MFYLYNVRKVPALDRKLVITDLQDIPVMEFESLDKLNDYFEAQERKDYYPVSEIYGETYEATDCADVNEALEKILVLENWYFTKSMHEEYTKEAMKKMINSKGLYIESDGDVYYCKKEGEHICLYMPVENSKFGHDICMRYEYQESEVELLDQVVSETIYISNKDEAEEMANGDYTLTFGKPIQSERLDYIPDFLKVGVPSACVNINLII